MTRRVVWMLSKIGTKRAATALVEGENVEIAGALFAAEQRYSDVWVVAQNISALAGHVSYFAKAHDDRVPRRRIQMLIMDMPGEGRNADHRIMQSDRSRRANLKHGVLPCGGHRHHTASPDLHPGSGTSGELHRCSATADHPAAFKA
jgi:hypothetical protein